MSPEQAVVVESQVAVLEPVRAAFEESEEEVEVEGDGAAAAVVEEEGAATGAAAEVVAGETGAGSSLVGAAEDAVPTSDGEENGEDDVAATSGAGAWEVSETTAGSLAAEVATAGVIVVSVVVPIIGA